MLDWGLMNPAFKSLRKKVEIAKKLVNTDISSDSFIIMLLCSNKKGAWNYNE